MIAGLGWPELVFILAIVLIIFGVGRIRKIGGELGGGIRAFKDSLQGDDIKEDKDESKTETSEKK